MRTNYVLVDLENVQPKSLDQLSHDHFKVLVFVGASQTKLPLKLAASLQQLGPRAEYFKISGNGSNALDFHIAYYIGQLAAADPTARFHIISKDKGFDPLVQHLRSKKVFAGRVKSIEDIPTIKASNAESPTGPLKVVLSKLQRLKVAKPRTVAALRSTISSWFGKKLPGKELEALVRGLATQGYITVSGAKVTYALPGDG